MNDFYLKNWEPAVYRRLNYLLTQYKSPKSTPNAKKQYVVFDFDNTSVINDIEDHTMFYMMQRLLYKLSPKDFHSILTSGPFDFDQILFSDRPLVTFRNLADDIYEQYCWLYQHYIQIEATERPNLSDVHKTEQFKAFSAKLRLYYTLAGSRLTRQEGKPWVTYWFAGYTEEELAELIKKVLDKALQTPFSKIELISSPAFPGKTGVVTTYFETGLSFPVELLDLYQAFKEKGIVTYIVSASPIGVVQVAGSEYAFNVPKERIFGMKYRLDHSGKIQSFIQAGTYVTKGPGKTDVIRQLIQPLHEGKDPVALFGDSMGDYHMMTHYTERTLNVLFNRYMENDTKQLVDLAVKEYNSPDSVYLVQGRNENTGQLRPSIETIPLGCTTPILTSEQFKGKLSLSE